MKFEKHIHVFLLINLKILQENPKMVNEINTDDLCLVKAAYCRCWLSKVSYDSSHTKDNELARYNVDPSRKQEYNSNEVGLNPIL